MTGAPKPAGMSLYGRDGRRKYLTAEERGLFLKTAEAIGGEVRTFCGLLSPAI
jgi:hypothetical protein